MTMDRRSFLRGTLAVAALSIAPIGVLGSGLPTIYGNGEDDDAPGLNAMLAGLPFDVEDNDIVASCGWLSGGVFAIRSPIVVRPQVHLVMAGDMTFRTLPDFNGDRMITLRPEARMTIERNVHVNLDNSGQPLRTGIMIEFPTLDGRDVGFIDQLSSRHEWAT